MNEYELDFKYILLLANENYLTERIAKIFPGEDFCLYADFPFDQRVFLYQYSYNKIDVLDTDYSCTYLWINHHVGNYIYAFDNGSNTRKIFAKILESEAYKSRDYCQFEKS